MGGCVGRYIANVWEMRSSKNKYEFDHRVDTKKVHWNIRPRDQERRTGDRRNKDRGTGDRRNKDRGTGDRRNKDHGTGDRRSKDHETGDRRTENHKGDDQEPVLVEISLEDPDKERRIGNYMDSQNTSSNNNHERSRAATTKNNQEHVPTVTEL